MTGTIRGLTLFFSALSILGFLPRLGSWAGGFWPLEANANFLGYYFVWHAAALFLLLPIKNKLRYFKTLYLLQVVLIAVISYDLIPFYFSSAEKPSEGRPLKMLYANVLTSNPNKAALSAQIKDNAPDIVALAEVNSAWRNTLNLKTDYPFQIEILREDNFGIGLYSKYKIIESITDFGSELPPAIDAILEIDPATKIHVAVLHTMPPASDAALRLNYLLLRRISTRVRFETLPTIVVGDFNATPFSRFYRKFIEWTYLKNAFHGGGLPKTWHAENPLIRLTLDHILFKNLTAGGAKILSPIGSDHLPIFANFYF